MSWIGKSPPRPDGFAKVSGDARFADDVHLEGLIYGATVRSPHAHARIEALRWSPEKAPEGAACVTAEDLEGPNGVQLLDDEWPILADSVTRHVGEAVALVAAGSRLDARRALAAVEVDYTPLAPVFDLEAAAAASLPMAELSMVSGNVDEALSRAERVIEGTYQTGLQEHIYIECQTMTARWENDGVVVMGSMQCPYYVQKSLVHALRLPPEKVRVRASVVGGGFGGKEDYPSLIALHAALLSRASGRPVRLAYDRHEDIVGTTKRHPAVVRHRTAVDEDGRLIAADIDVRLDGGAYPTLSKVVLSRAVLHAVGPYRCPKVRVRGRVLRTNTAPNGAFRGFGAPQTQFAAERQMDRIARRLGMDPLEIRRCNALEPGDSLPTGQILDDSTSARACLEAVAAKTDFQARWKQMEAQRQQAEDGAIRRGIGLSLYFHGAGFTGDGERRMRSPVTSRLRSDGRVEVQTSMIDMGQGCAAIFPQIACEAGGLSPSDLVFAPPDTSRVPDSGPTVASRATMIVGGSIARSVSDLVAQVLSWWSEGRGLDGEVVAENGVVRADGGERFFRDIAASYLSSRGPLEVTHRHAPPAWQDFDEQTYQGDAYPTFSWGADVVEVEMDPDTLAVRPRRVTAVCEVGRAIHPTLCVGQVEGGTLQSVAWGLLEEVKVEEGRYLNDRLATYIVPTFKDSPEIDVELLESPWEEGPFGAKGVGELPMDGGAPAAVAAVESASGIEICEIPATPEKILEARTAGRLVAAADVPEREGDDGGS